MHTEEGSNIPPEILDRVFGHCERVFKSDIHGPVFAPKSRLHPLLFVCREWHDIAERRLYSSVSLGSDRIVKDKNGSKMEIKGKDVCRRFCETVQSNPRLASLVRELHLGTNHINVEETEIHIRLLGVCKNVEKAEIHGFPQSLVNDLKTSLAKVDLISLDLSSRTLGNYWSSDGETLFPLSDFISLLQNWPRIENVYANLGEDDYWRYGGDTTMNSSPSKETPGCPGCPTLRTISIYGGTFTPVQLRQLANISPRIEKLSIKVRNKCNATLQQCLQVWSSSLKYLTVLSPIFDRLSTGVGECPIICSPMAELRELWASSPMVTPEDMVYLPKLEKLNFRGEYSHGVDLARLIKNGELPCLTDIDVAFSNPKSSDTFSEEEDGMMCVQIAKDLRKECGKRRIFLRDPFTEVEELEERYGYPESEPESLDNDWCDFEQDVDLSASSPRIMWSEEDGEGPW